MLVAPATGVRRRLYRAFATHLAGAGFDVLTWDWRGTGDSRPATLRGYDASLSAWATRDLVGAIAWGAERTAPGARLLAVGHSFGGQAVGLAPNAHRLAALVTVAAQSGYWRHWPGTSGYRYAALWYIVMPVLTAAFGYFPSSRLGLGEDLPAGVAREWARWCRAPGYLGDFADATMTGFAGHRAFRAPVLAVSFSDDPFASPRAVDALHREYAAAAVTRRHVRPADVGAREIGHFGFFREGRTPGLWDEVAAWLRAGGRGA